jgi:hypothetical protein
VSKRTNRSKHNPRSLRKGDETLLRPNPRIMDLLGGYGSSSDEDEQPRTTMAMLPLNVIPSKKELVWSTNYQKVKEFYDKKKQHTCLFRVRTQIMRDCLGGLHINAIAPSRCERTSWSGWKVLTTKTQSYTERETITHGK